MHSEPSNVELSCVGGLTRRRSLLGRHPQSWERLPGSRAEDHVSFNDMLDTILAQDMPSLSRISRTYLFLLSALRDIQVSVQLVRFLLQEVQTLVFQHDLSG